MPVALCAFKIGRRASRKACRRGAS
ncbi:DUF1534 domain-containing protein, partial [Pseudomonas syringae]|nr:DUF1534 domain-containing protein [Pseudomonas syringae]